jgi:7-carboxy-7-deazaguanine synthase
MITLSREGIFPIVVSPDDKRLTVQTGLDMAGTVQGEGKLMGVPSLFIRLQGCNLRCVWRNAEGEVCRCDTAHSSFEKGEATRVSYEYIMSVVEANMGSMRHVVITGGEPFLQSAELIPLLDGLHNAGCHVTIETNGTIFDAEVVRRCDLLSISPKLSSSNPTAEKLSMIGLVPNVITERHEKIAVNIDVLCKLIDHSVDYQLKFVVGNDNDEKLIKDEVLSHLPEINPSDVIVMPLGATAEEIALSDKSAIPMSIRNGWRYTPRLHVMLWGNKEGV